MQPAVENTVSVLVVDDDRATSKMLRYNLENKDTRVIETDTFTSDAMSMPQEKQVGLILINLKFPGHKEWSVINSLRAKESLRTTPIIVISPEHPGTRFIKQFEPNDYLQAPFDIRDLLTMVHRFIGRSAA